MKKFSARDNCALLGVATGLLLTLPMLASADTVFGVYAGAGTWQQNYSGEIRSGVSDIDLEDDLGITDDMNNVFYLALEHPLPALPNLKFNYVDLSIDGDSVLTRTIEFNDEIFTAGSALTSDVQIKQGDAVAYYELLDNYLSLDLGIGARYMDGKIEMASSSDFSNAEFTVVLPMLYGRARADLPSTGLWMAAEVMGMGYSGNSLIDATAQIGWESAIGLGAELGYRLIHLDIEDFDDVDKAQMDISGPYLALNYHF